MVACNVSVQIMHETAPITRLWEICEADTPSMAFITYRGEVPMAPKTMPRVIINPDAVRGECVCADLIFINGQTAYNMTAGRNHAENDIFFRTGKI